MNWKATIIVLLIIASLLPAQLLYKYLAKRMRPRESGRRFLVWMVTVFAIIFAYTFVVVFLIRMIFPNAWTHI